MIRNVLFYDEHVLIACRSQFSTEIDIEIEIDSLKSLASLSSSKSVHKLEVTMRNVIGLS